MDEQGRRQKERELGSSRPPRQRRCGVSRRTPPSGLSSQRGAWSEPALRFLSRRIGILVGLPQAVAAQQEDLGVFYQAVGDGGGDGRIEEDVAPVGERCIGGNDGRTLLAVTCGDHLIEEIGSLLIEGQVP